MRIGFFGDRYVGKESLSFLFEFYPDDIKCIVVVDESSELISIIKENKFDFNNVIYSKDLYKEETIKFIRELNLDYIVLAWWPQIIKKPILGITKKGIVNFHPSLLPYCRGKNPNFWSIVEEVPFGVSIHFIDDGIDSGEIIFQKEIDKTWEDTGETLYNKSLINMVRLFKESYPKLLKEEFNTKKQESEKKTFHYFKELDKKCEIILEKEYKAKDLLNLIRARTFEFYPACYFYDEGEKYEVRININKVLD